MVWQLIFLVVIFLLIISLTIKFKIVFNILRLSGAVEIVLFKIIRFKLNVRFRGPYVYIAINNKTRREKLSSKNFNIAFVVQLSRQIYFRTHLEQLKFNGDIGYYNNAMVTAMASSIIDIVGKCLGARILHNKKSAHIFVSNETKYNQDSLNLRLEGKINISIFDIIYSLINALWSLKGVSYERTDFNIEQN